MNNTKSTKRALLASVLALAVTVSMLIGSTFAWFTDNTSAKVNTIQAGTLDVMLEMKDENGNWVDAEGKTLNWVTTDEVDNVLWEPGCTYKLPELRVKNNGDLDLKYQIVITGLSGDAELLKVITFTYNGMPNEGVYHSLEAGKTTDAFVIEGHMDEAAGNEYMGKKIENIAITLYATQLNSEADSYGPDYDKDATLPASASVTVRSGNQAPVELTAGDITVTLPAETSAGVYSLKVVNKVESEDSVSYEVTLLKDGVEQTGDYSVTVAVAPLKKITGITNGENTINTYDYNALTGEVSFEAATFSRVVINHNDLPAKGAEIKDGKIVSGVFEGINPATIDATLAEADSEYIAVNYEQDGKTYYAVSRRTETVVLCAADTVYTAINGNYTPKNASGKLWSEISALKDNEHSTVYLLPGTYNEGTTIYVYSSMDIIGLGDKEDIKVVKTSSSSSNRHLFNVNGTKTDYIEVTIRNMTLDATAKTTNNKDNAAVQSIRKSKVKCYDLDIIKGTGWDAVAFYVNGNNAVDGVKYTAYLYAEDCTLNTTRTFGVVTTSGSYKFYHNNLTYAGNTYTNNSGSIKNVKLDADNWDWLI